jgi:hypothetical protein
MPDTRYWITDECEDRAWKRFNAKTQRHKDAENYLRLCVSAFLAVKSHPDPKSKTGNYKKILATIEII